MQTATKISGRNPSHWLRRSFARNESEECRGCREISNKLRTTKTAAIPFSPQTAFGFPVGCCHSHPKSDKSRSIPSKMWPLRRLMSVTTDNYFSWIRGSSLRSVRWGRSVEGGGNCKVLAGSQRQQRRWWKTNRVETHADCLQRAKQSVNSWRTLSRVVGGTQTNGSSPADCTF